MSVDLIKFFLINICWKQYRKNAYRGGACFTVIGRAALAFSLTSLFIFIVSIAPVGAQLGSPQTEPNQELALRGQASTVVAKGFNVAVQESSTFFTIILSKEVQANLFAMETPNRLIIDLPEVEFHVSSQMRGQKAGLVSSFRFGLFAQGRSRVVIELKEPVTARAFQGKVDKQTNTFFYTLELKRSTRTEFSQFVAKTAANAKELSVIENPSQAGAPEPRAKGRFVVVIDPGHGGIDSGATTQNNVQEKDIVFAFAQSVAEHLKKMDQFQVIMTRSTDVFVPLGERVKIAQRAQADLFISIHADSISAAPQVSGFTVYTVSEKASDRESARLADRENQADSVAGIESHQIKEQVVDILQELTVRETRAFSKHFAQTITRHFKSVMRLNKNPYRQAGFHVLKGYDVPSILIELGYMSSQKDIDLLTSEEWREKATRAIVLSIVDFFEERKTQN